MYTKKMTGHLSYTARVRLTRWMTVRQVICTIPELVLEQTYCQCHHHTRRKTSALPRHPPHNRASLQSYTASLVPLGW